MVVRFRKKLRRQRGKRWHGWGSKKKHRGKGSLGGSGMSGHKKHKRSYIYANKIDYFGKRGFYSGTDKEQIINLDMLEKLAKEKKSTNIDLSALGYTKLLGRGEVNKAYAITVAKASQSAIEKIEAAKGKVTVTQSAEDREEQEPAEEEKK